MKPEKSAAGETVTIAEIHMTELRCNIIGTSPFVPHAVSAKSKGSLLFPAPKKNAAERASSMKHEPYEEFLEAAYRYMDEDNQPTRMYMVASAFHRAMAAAAIDMVGAKKAQIGRLTEVMGQTVPIFGVPKIWCTIVRSSDMARTPDVRTLPILPKWACTLDVQFVGSLIKEQSILNLLGAAGVIVGVGDGRKEKGKLNMGKFRLCNDDDPEFLDIIKNGGTEAQDAALKNPEPFDLETKQLLEWFNAERGRRAAAPAPQPRKSKKIVEEVVAANKNGGGKEVAV